MSLALVAQVITEIEPDTTAVVTLSAALIAALGLFVPIVTALITKATLPGWIAGSITLLLSSAWGFVTNAVTDDGAAVFSRESLFLAVISWVSAIAMYNNIWEPAARVGAPTTNKTLGPRFGLGKAA